MTSPSRRLAPNRKILLFDGSKCLKQLLDAPAFWIGGALVDDPQDRVPVGDGDADPGDELAIMVDGEVVPSIEFDTLSAVFFPDEDFLGIVNLMDPRVPQEILDVMGFRETTAAVRAGMRPHPDELRLIPMEEPDDWAPDASGPRWWHDRSSDPSEGPWDTPSEGTAPF